MPRNRLRIASSVFFLSALFASGGGPASPAASRAADAPDALAALNDASRAAYRRAKDDALARCGPVVLLEGDDLVLKYGLQRVSVNATPEVYTTLKTVGHIPLALYALLEGSRDAALDDKRLFDLKQYRGLVVEAAKSLDGRGLSEKQAARQKTIIQESLKLIDAALESRQVDGKRLAGCLLTLRPLLEENTTDAARAEIDLLDRQMTAFKAKLTDKEWKQLTVVVMGSQPPRKDNLAVQYFARLLGETGEGKRIIYSEAIWDETKALDLMAARLVDERIGADVFDDPTRMHRDLLGKAGKDYLDELFRGKER
jgi:hypothetical protein